MTCGFHHVTAASTGCQSLTDSSGCEERIHAQGLSGGEEVHAYVVGVVHVILYHVRGSATNVSEGTAVVWIVRIRCVGYEIIRAARAIAPDVAQV